MDSVTNINITKDFIDSFKVIIEAKDDEKIKVALTGFKAEEITDVLYDHDSESSKYVLDLLEPTVSARIIADLDEDVQASFLKVLEPSKIAFYLDYLHSDDGADVLNQLDTKTRELVIREIDNEEKANNLLDLLQYEEDVAGGLMAKELIKCHVNSTILECIEEIRKQRETVDKIYSVYVVDDDEKLLGKVSLKKIILSPDDTKVKDIFTSDIISIETYLQEEEVAKIMRKYDLEAIPVINARGKLVGRITIDDIVEVMSELAEEERQLMSGISSDVEEDDSVIDLLKARLPWLIVGLVGGLLGGWFMRFFEEDIIVIPAIAFFVPLITATGGNVGIQSSSLIVQSLASDSLIAQTFSKRLFKVSVVAILNGILLAIVVFIVVFMVTGQTIIGVTVACSLFCVVLLASFTGTVTPLMLNRLGVNPALASGPFITTANDLLGLAVYFFVAHALLTV